MPRTFANHPSLRWCPGAGFAVPFSSCRGPPPALGLARCGISLGTNPRVPTLRAVFSIWAGSFWLTIRMLVSGTLSRMMREASGPFISGIEASHEG